MLQQQSSVARPSTCVALAGAVRDDKRLWAAAVNGLSNSLAILDASGKIIAVNEAWRIFARDIGLPDSNAALGAYFVHAWESSEATNSADTGRAANGIRAVLEGREPNFSMEFAWTRPEQQRWFRLQATPIGERASQGAIVVYEDITSRLLCEIALEQSRRELQEQRNQLESRVAERTQRTRAIMDAALNAIVTADHEDRIESFNAAAARLFGCAAEQAIGQPLSNFFVQPDENSLAEPTGGAGAWSETFALRRDKTTIPVFLSKSDLVFEGGKLRILIAHDISDRRAIESELSDKAEELARRNKELDEFTYVASHDLQEPLRKLIAFSELLAKDMAGEIPEPARRDLHFITEAAARMQQLIQDLLTLARASRAELRRVEILLNNCTDRTLGALNYRIVETGAEITRDALPSVVADACLIEQLYQNLIGNAIKFCGAKPPRIHLSAQREKTGWVFGVLDSGIGIAPEYATMIFAPFKRLHSRESYEGTGIGLAICRKAVERHGGRIWVESALGQGSHFKFTLG